jgi:hypothetical protein
LSLHSKNAERAHVKLPGNNWQTVVVMNTVWMISEY